MVRWFARFARWAARSRGEHPGAAPELRAAQAQKGADRTLVAHRAQEVSHSLMAARQRTVAARPFVAADRSWAVAHSRAAARKRTAVDRNRVAADRTRGVGSHATGFRSRRMPQHSRA
jgi:hypothetical protein